MSLIFKYAETPDFNSVSATGVPNKSKVIQVYATETSEVIFTFNHASDGTATAEVDAAQCVTDDTVAIKSASVTLTDAQIKALPTAQITILAAPGAGKRYMYHGGQVVIRHTAGAYTNIHSGDPNAAQFMVMAGPQVSLAEEIGWILEDASEAGLAELPSRVNVGSGDFAGYNTGFSDYLSEYEDQPLRIRGINGSGNFTGGNAANTMDVTVFYSIVDV